MEMRKFVVPEFIFGTGALSMTGSYIRHLGASKVLLVTGPHVLDMPWEKDYLASLRETGVPYAIFHGITPNPKDHEVMAGADFYEKEGCDMIVTIGGGSVIDCAKAIGIVTTNRKDVLDFEGVDEVDLPGPPLICIPTTAGTGADISQFAIILDTKRKVKIAIISKTVVPDVALVDPATTVTMPPTLTAHVGMDALVHAVEAYVSNARSTFTDLYALEAIRLIWTNIATAYREPGNRLARENMMMGSHLAGMAFSNASLGLVHGMAHSLGGLKDAPHGLCNALLLEYVVDFNYDASPDRYDDIAVAVGLDIAGMSQEEKKKQLVHALTELRLSLDITETLSDLGVTRDDLSLLSRHAFNDPCLATNPKAASEGAIGVLYEKAL